jgi:ATP-dependent DNA helicase DinG
MRSVNYALSSQLAGEKIDLFIQSGSRRRTSLLKMFASTKNTAILMGTYSFWEGIDLPGDAVQIVIIPKLPFDVPNDPVVSARIDKLKAEGENAFAKYQLPNAVLRTRQGAGRLIRTATDRGVVMILDSRIISKSYGSSFRKVLQGTPVVPNSVDELVKGVGEFFNRIIVTDTDRHNG